MSCSKEDFTRAYNEIVVGKEFVEYKDYYRNSLGRFWNSFDAIQKLNLPGDARVIDIGGGIMAVLLSQILGMNCTVGDVTSRSEGEINAFGLPFQHVNLLSDDTVPSEQYDLVVLQEVIEHLPQPPYVVFERIKRFLKPDGILYLTTPNGTRIRNILYMLMGKNVLDNFRYPAEGEAMGHQQEYTLSQMLWQVKRADMVPLVAEQCADGWKGASAGAKLAYKLTSLLHVFAHLRPGLMLAVKRA